MIETLLITLGGIVLVLCIVYYWRDCKGKPAATMGGEMSFSVFWTFGIILFLLGSLPLLGFSRWWTISSVPVMYIASFPLRNILQRCFCTPFKEDPTGFQQFVRKTEGTANKAIDND